MYVFFSQATNQASKPVVPASTTESPDTQQGQAAQEDTCLDHEFIAIFSSLEWTDKRGENYIRLSPKLSILLAQMCMLCIMLIKYFTARLIYNDLDGGRFAFGTNFFLVP